MLVGNLVVPVVQQAVLGMQEVVEVLVILHQLFLFKSCARMTI